MNSLRVLLIWVLTASVLIGQAVLPNRRKVFQSAGGGETALNDNLITYWKMDETGTSTRTDSQGANDLTVSGTGINHNAGLISNAADFLNTTGARIEIADNADLSFGDEDFSFSGWLWLDTHLAADSYILAKLDAGTFEYYLRIESTDDNIYFGVSNDGTALTHVQASTYGVVPTGEWVFIACGHDAANNVLWISVNDGTVNTAAHTTGCNDNTSKYCMGDSSTFSRPLDGRLDEWGVWGKRLSAAEITALRNSGSGITCCPFP